MTSGMVSPGQGLDAQAAPELYVRVLGRVVAHGPLDEVVVRGRQPSAVLARLALSAGATTRDELADLLWGEHLSSHWQGALRGVLAKVRASLAEAGFAHDVVQTRDNVVQLAIGSISTDLTDIEALLASPRPDIDQLERAASALQLPFLPNDDSEWGRRARDRIGAASRRLVRVRARMLVDVGRVDDAAALLGRAVAEDPLDESAVHDLVVVLLAAGRRAAATLAFERLVTSLADEFGIAPSPETSALFAAASTTDPIAAAPTDGPDPPDDARPAIHPHSGDPFVGRTAELARMEECWDRTRADAAPQLIVLDGPPGMGKTRLADEFCRRVWESGAVGTVLWGRNRGYGNRVYGAFAEAIGRLALDRPDVLARLGDALDLLRPLLPTSTEPVLSSMDAGSAAQPTAVARGLRLLLSELGPSPTILFLDDLQWTSADDLGILELVLDGLRAPIFVIATSRTAPPEIAGALAALQRVVPTTTLALDGLSRSEVGELFDDATTARRVADTTAGLPFYASEIARLTRLSGGSTPLGEVPPVIADWITRRVAALERDLVHVLTLASVIGDEIDLDVLTRCSSLGAADVARAVDDLVASGLLTASSRSGLQFSHAITRDVVYDGIGPATRLHLHRHVGDTLAALPDSLRSDAEVAHHYRHAGVEARSLAFEHSRRAGDAALNAGAWSTAAARFVEAIDTATVPAQRADALVGLGRARLGEERFDDAVLVLTEALQIGDAHGLAPTSARAALGLVGRAGRGALHDGSDEEQIRLLRSALRGLLQFTPEPGSDDEFVLPELLSDVERELALSLLLTDAATERHRLLTGSLDRIRQLRPTRPRALANALLGARYALLDPGHLDDRLQAIDEVLALPAMAVGPDARIAARCYQHEDLLRSGQFDAASAAAADAEAMLEQYPHPYWTWALRTWRSMSDILRGDLDAAERHAFEAVAMRSGVVAAGACLAVNLVNIRLYQGRSDEMVHALVDAVAANPEIPTYRAVLALCAAETGDHELAERSLAAFAADRFEGLPHDTNRFLGLAVLAHAAADVGATEVGADLADLLQPYRHQWVVLNCYGGGGAVWGPTSHALARLARLAGDVGRADELFAQATVQAAATPLVLERILRDAGADRDPERSSSAR